MQWWRLGRSGSVYAALPSPTGDDVLRTRTDRRGRHASPFDSTFAHESIRHARAETHLRIGEMMVASLGDEAAAPSLGSRPSCHRLDALIDHPDAAIVESPFVGASRIALVEALLDAFDRVRTSCEPLWISLESPTGWGKTRVVQEFYKRLAEERQRVPHYWPNTLLDSAGDARALSTPEGRRKRVYPERPTRAAGSEPEWFWWGVSCAFRHGTPTESLADDLNQLRVHIDHLEHRWARHARLGARVRHGARRRRRDAGEAAVESIAENLVEVAIEIPLSSIGLGLAALLTRWAADAIPAREHFVTRLQSVETLDATKRGDPDLVDELAVTIPRLAIPELPIVIFIEDIHLADSSLVDLLARLVQAPRAAILVVTSTWPGEIDDRTKPVSEFLARVPPNRVQRVTQHPDDESAPLFSGISLEQLAPDDLAKIVRHALPRLDDDSVHLLVEHYPNPLALEVAANLGRLRRLHDGAGAIHLDEADLHQLPRKIADLYRAAWDELPRPIQDALAIASAATPDAVSEDWGFRDDRWDTRIVAAVLAAAASDLAADGAPSPSTLAQAESHYGWVRELDPWLRRFVEPEQRHIANEFADDEFDDDLLATIAETLTADALTETASAEETRHRARLVVALHAIGVHTAVDAASAMLTLARELARSPCDAKSVERLTASAFDETESPPSPERARCAASTSPRCSNKGGRHPRSRRLEPCSTSTPPSSEPTTAQSWTRASFLFAVGRVGPGRRGDHRSPAAPRRAHRDPRSRSRRNVGSAPRPGVVAGSSRTL